MWFSDLENLLSIGRIFYQLGACYLNLFLLHKVKNLWSVWNLWSILTSLSALGDFLSNLGEGNFLHSNKWPSIHDFEPIMSHKMLSFCDFTLFWYSFPKYVFFFKLLGLLLVWCNWWQVKDLIQKLIGMVCKIVYLHIHVSSSLGSFKWC